MNRLKWEEHPHPGVICSRAPTAIGVYFIDQFENQFRLVLRALDQFHWGQQSKTDFISVKTTPYVDELGSLKLAAEEHYQDELLFALDGWRTMETAPKDRPIVLYNHKRKEEYFGFEWFEERWAFVKCDQAGPYVTQVVQDPEYWREWK